MGNCVAYTFKPAEAEREAYGFIALSAARGPVVIFAALFASIALAAFAVSVSDCDGRILNGALQASSVLSALGVVEGVVNGLLSPMMGAFADLTPHRKPALLATILLFTVLVFAQGVLFMSDPKGGPNPKANPKFNLSEFNISGKESSSNRRFLEVPLFQSDSVLLLLSATIVLQVAAYEMAALLTGGYSAELTQDLALQSHYVAKSYMMLNVMQVATVVVVFGLQTFLGLATLQSGTYGAFATGLLTLMWFVPGSFWIGHRKLVSSEMDKRCCGLRHTGTMITDITRQYSELNKFLIAWCTSSAAMSSITTLATSYLTFHLGFEGLVTPLLGLALIFTVPGSWLAKPAVRKLGVKKTLILVNIAFGISFILAPILLTAEPTDLPEGTNGTVLTQYGFCDNVEATDTKEKLQKANPGVFFITAFFTAMWGIGIGIFYPVGNVWYARMVPGGRESSFFGIKVTYSKLLVWAPPLVFTAINEYQSGIYLRWAILVLVPFFFVSAIILYFVDMEKGEQQVESTIHLRRGQGYQHAGELANGKMEPLSSGKVEPLASEAE